MAEVNADHLPGPWDPLPEGYRVELRKYRPADKGYYYLMCPKDPDRPYAPDSVDQTSGRFTPETVAKRFRPTAKAHVEKMARERRERAEVAACKGLRTEALESGAVQQLVEVAKVIADEWSALRDHIPLPDGVISIELTAKPIMDLEILVALLDPPPELSERAQRRLDEGIKAIIERYTRPQLGEKVGT